jgi:hypothetical protein
MREGILDRISGRPYLLGVTPLCLVTSRIAIAAAAAVALFAVAPATAPEGQVAAIRPDALTPLVASVVAAPRPVAAADGRRHLAYELVLANPSSSTVTIQKVEILDSATGIAIATVDGPALAGLMARAGGGGYGNALPPGIGGSLVMDAALAGEDPLPKALVHRFTVSLEPDPPHAAHVFSSGLTSVVAENAVVIDPPLRGARWVVGDGCCARRSAHRGAVLPVNGAFHVAERFAIDFVQLDERGRLFDGPGDALSSYKYYGAEILSVADGVVAATMDGLPENVPGRLPAVVTAATAGGNYAVVDIGGGRFAFYAHMQPSSLRVRVGQRVVTGQLLGRLGNSGNSDAPHLHFHVMDSPAPLGSNGLPYVFRSFRGEGTVTAADLDTLLTGRPAAIAPALSGQYSDRLPLDLQVVSFGDGRSR